ncbi:MAG: class I SAM-dependent methyltransferase [Nitriliruptorales bacterium]
MTSAEEPESLVLTGERTLPGVPDERYWFERHVVAYELAAAKAAGLRVLDAGCGEGYGAEMLRRAGAERVVAVDLDERVAAHADRAYPEVAAVVAELSRLPLAPGSIDLVVCFQVVEHVWDVPALLGSLRRVLAARGELILSTPNRLTFTPDQDGPANPFHVREFSPDELRDELTTAGFHVGGLLGVHHGPGLQLVERVTGPLHDVLGGDPPSWPRGLRPLVHRVRPSWFRLRADQLESSLDLIALCRRRRRGGSGDSRSGPGGLGGAQAPPTEPSVKSLGGVRDVVPRRKD